MNGATFCLAFRSIGMKRAYKGAELRNEREMSFGLPTSTYGITHSLNFCEAQGRMTSPHYIETLSLYLACGNTESKIGNLGHDKLPDCRID